MAQNWLMELMAFLVQNAQTNSTSTLLVLLNVLQALLTRQYLRFKNAYHALLAAAHVMHKDFVMPASPLLQDNLKVRISFAKSNAVLDFSKQQMETVQLAKQVVSTVQARLHAQLFEQDLYLTTQPIQ